MHKQREENRKKIKIHIDTRWKQIMGKKLEAITTTCNYSTDLKRMKRETLRKTKKKQQQQGKKGKKLVETYQR